MHIFQFTPGLLEKFLTRPVNLLKIVTKPNPTIDPCTSVT